MLDLPEGLDEVAAICKAALHPDLARLEPGGTEQLGGLFHPELLNLLEAPAEKGDTVGYRGLEFKVTRTENGGVERCTVTRITTLMREEVLEEEE